MCGPHAGFIQRTRFQQPDSEQALPATKIDQALGIGNQPMFKQAKKGGVALEFTFGKAPGKNAGRFVWSGGAVE